MDEFYKRMSVRLYDIMEYVGASEEVRQLYQSTATHLEIMQTMQHQMEDLNLSAYIFGSFMEGTTTPALHSDIDMLVSQDRYPVHENIAEASEGVSLLMVRDAHTRPGYVKLQCMTNGIPHTVDNSCMNNSLDSDRNGRMVYKHISIDEHVGQRNGPADTHFLSDCYFDLVNAYRCSSIPSFADDWTKQKCQFNWPSKQMIDNMTSSGCFFVGVGHPASDEKHLEWRLSFSLQERDLMLSFNPTQHKCYILLKMVKNDIIGRKVGKCISSYHMKTCMFCIIQTTRQELWKPENLCRCLILCLDVLLKWVNCGYCPNHFIKEENMFDRDIHRQVKLQLSTLLEILIQAGPKILLFGIDCENINQYLVHPERLPANYANAKNRRDWLRGQSLINECKFRHWFLSWCMKNKDCTSLCLFLNIQLKLVKNTPLCNRKPDKYYRQALFRIKTYIQYELGCICMSISFYFRESILKDHFLKLANHHFKQGRYCDKTSSRLMYSYFHYKTEHYDRCIFLLEDIEAGMGYNVESSCSCYQVEYVDYVGKSRLKPSSAVNIASCVVFLPLNRVITPAPLLPEMYRSVDTPPGSRDEMYDFWFDCATVDGKVYLYFLKYLVYTKLDQHEHTQVAIDNIQRLAESEPNLGHRDTAYNLLGWILVQENRIVDGIQCLVKSWRIRPVHNAAKWHLGIAVYKHITQNQE